MNEVADIFKAAAEGAMERLKALSEAGVDINARGQGGVTALHMACMNGHLELARWLLENGAKPNARTQPTQGERHGCYPIHEAVMSGHLEVVKLLIEFKAKVNVKASDGFTPLMCAVETGNLGMCQLLLEQKPDLDRVGQEGAAIHIAVEYPDILRLLLKAGANLETEIPYLKMSPLIHAAFCNIKDSVKMLLESGADVHHLDADRQSALHSTAIAWGSRQDEAETLACIENVKVLLAAGVDRQLKDKRGLTAFDYARRNGAKEIKELLEQTVA